MEGRAWRVRGTVQGVGFRWWTRRTAQGLEVFGTVRNETDGSVSVTAWGPAEALVRLEDWLGRGPPGARVEAVEELPRPAGPPPDDFGIVR